MQKVHLLNSLSENVGSLVMCQKCIRESQNVQNKIVLIFQNVKHFLNDGILAQSKFEYCKSLMEHS